MKLLIYIQNSKKVKKKLKKSKNKNKKIKILKKVINEKNRINLSLFH